MTKLQEMLLLIQKVKRDIIFRRMNLPPSAQQITDPRRLAAHLDSTIRRLCSYLQYIGLVKHTKAADQLSRVQEFNLAWGGPEIATTLNLPDFHDKNYLSHTNTVTCAHPACSALQTQFKHPTLWKPCTHVLYTPPTRQPTYSYWYNAM